MKPVFISLTYCILLSSLLPANDFSSENIHYIYDPNAELQVNYRVALKANDSLAIYLRIKIGSEVYELTDYLIQAEYKSAYDEKLRTQIDTLDLLEHIIIRKNNAYYFKLTIPRMPNQNLLVLYFANQHNQNKYLFDIPLKKHERLGNLNIIPFGPNNLPLFQNFIPFDDSFYVLEEATNENVMYWYVYKKDFEVADPPMILDPGYVESSLTIDSSFLFSSNRWLNLNQEGLLLVQKDTNSLHGLGIRITDNYFPKVAYIDDIFNALRYFSTRSEWNKLKDAKNKKLALDNYWLQVAKTKERAKKIIKHYFDRVELANRLFTNYKKGWKTDKGMIYIIFGKPDEVYRNEGNEIWIYNKNEEFPKLRFSFSKVPNIFTDTHYVLNREKGFQEHWFKAVDLWRKGRFEKIFE